MSEFSFEGLAGDILEGVSGAVSSVSEAARDATSDMRRRKSFIDVGRDLFVGGLTTSHGGNMSVSDGQRIWITRTGAMLGRLSSEDIIETPWYADVADENASSELLVHRAIYHALAAFQRQGVSGFGDVAPGDRGAAQSDGSGAGAGDGQAVFPAAVIHAHPAATIACSLLDDAISVVDSEGQMRLGDEVKVIKALKTVASQEVSDMMADLILAQCRIAVVRGHGPFAVAPTLQEAFGLISCLEHSCDIINIMSSRLAKR
jgi:L-fuculose-phosphate aldolase